MQRHNDTRAQNEYLEGGVLGSGLGHRFDFEVQLKAKCHA